MVDAGERGVTTAWGTDPVGGVDAGSARPVGDGLSLSPW